MKKLILSLCCLWGGIAFAQGSFQAVVHEKADAIEERVIEWRRYLHEHPELSNREFETAKMVAAHLEELGLEVKREVAHTGVVGILRGGKPGKTVALRADMDALPVTERVDVPFASKARNLPATIINQQKRFEKLPVPSSGFITVGEGDTLFVLANRYDVTPFKIISENKLEAPFKLMVGQVLKLVPRNTHLVRLGDSLFSIAE